jgi:hypothetical protein
MQQLYHRQKPPDGDFCTANFCRFWLAVYCPVCDGRIWMAVALMLPSEFDVPWIVTFSPTERSAGEPMTLLSTLVPAE